MQLQAAKGRREISLPADILSKLANCDRQKNYATIFSLLKRELLLIPTEVLWRLPVRACNAIKYLLETCEALPMHASQNRPENFIVFKALSCINLQDRDGKTFLSNPRRMVE